jgi:dTDP-4-amino-4,6-dideoxygalactose transaminase
LSASSILLPADPKANYLAHKDEINQAILRVLDSGRYILGHEVTAFEQEFAQYIGVQSTIGTASGTDAIHLALRACGICHGDAVFTVSHTAVATVAAIELAGGIPVLVDIEPATFTMDPNSLEEAIKKYRKRRWLGFGSSLKAIIPVHLYGHPADMPAIMDIASRYNLSVIEDCAQSNGAAIRERRAGTWGHLSAFSFYPTKNLGALGDGGAIITNDLELAERARLAREYGWRERYISYLPGMNTRLDEIQAAILRVKLQYLDEENARRQQIAGIYDAFLSSTTLILPLRKGSIDHVYHQYVVCSNQRDDLRRFLKANSIHTLVHYPVPVHLQPAYQKRVVISPGGLRQTEQVCKKILSLPIHPQMTNEQVQRVIESIYNWCKRAIGKG